MIESQIEELFPIPIYTTELKRNFSDNENKFVAKLKKDIDPNQGNVNTLNNYVLNEKPFKGLKKELDLILKDYCNKIYQSSDDFNLYITQSWITYTQTNEYHHAHSHSNSIISGVVYLNADENNDKIRFYKREYYRIKPNFKNFNRYNSASWWFPVKTGRVMLFPSDLIHSVDIKQGSNLRICLAFNTFIKGKLGNNKALEELIV